MPGPLKQVVGGHTLHVGLCCGLNTRPHAARLVVLGHSCTPRINTFKNCYTLVLYRNVLVWQLIDTDAIGLCRLQTRLRTECKLE